MIHIMIDIYGSETEKLNDLKAVYETIFKVTNYLSVKTVMPPVLVPYYYGQVKEDDGISAFVFLSGGHFTIHTFPERECYFVDLLYNGFVNEEKLLFILKQELPFQKHKIYSADRRFNIENQIKSDSIDANLDFGPHYLLRTTVPCELTMEQIYHFLDETPSQIAMEPILRPIVITDKIKDYTVISGLTVIAQSHISLHYYPKEKIAYIDIFSCSFIDCDHVDKTVEQALNITCDTILISRGSKHNNKLAQREDVIRRYNKWQDNIQ